MNPQTNVPNRVIVPLGPEQDVCVYNSLGSINFILDVNGWLPSTRAGIGGASRLSPIGVSSFPVHEAP